ncbi:MAG: chloride channel protein [Rhodanobacteraceae bacterium]
MWWPAIGALAVGIGGLIDVRALGVGYSVIDQLLTGKIVGIAILIFMVAKALAWIVYLGSGTSGGVLAPMLALGAGLGGLEALFFPGPHQLWPLMGMCGIPAGMMRMPFTSILFALELTHDSSALPAFLVVATVAYGASVFLMKRSILTEKVARHGFSIFREYSINRLEITPVKDVMSTEVVTVCGDLSLAEVTEQYFGVKQRYRAYPVLGGDGKLLGVLSRTNLQKFRERYPDGDAKLAKLMTEPLVVAYPDDSCQRVAVRASVANLDRLPVVDRDSRKLLGVVTRFDLLKPYTHYQEDELLHERVFHVFHGRWHPR